MDIGQIEQGMREFAADVIRRYNAGEALDDSESSMARQLGLPPRTFMANPEQPGEDDHWERCTVCDGTGYLREDSCGACDGQGGFVV